MKCHSKAKFEYFSLLEKQQRLSLSLSLENIGEKQVEFLTRSAFLFNFRPRSTATFSLAAAFGHRRNTSSV